MRRLTLIAALMFIGIHGSAQADLIKVEFWDVAARFGNPITSGSPELNPIGGSYLTAVDSIIASRSADAIFQSSGIDYGASGGYSAFQTLGTFLGADAATLTPDLAGTVLLGSIFRFTGTIALDPGDNVFNIFSDDGFRLLINGINVDQFDGLRPPSSGIPVNVLSLGGGTATFELVYFEAQQVLGAITARRNGEVITAVTEPSTLALLGMGLIGLGLARRRRREY